MSQHRSSPPRNRKNGGQNRSRPADRPASEVRAKDARGVALEVLARIEDDGAYANLALSAALGRSDLSDRDRAFVTALVDGTTRMRRACDHLVDRFLTRHVEPQVRRCLRLGAFQLAYLGTPAHAAVAATVEVAPRRARGLVNAVLRRVSENPIDPTATPADGGWPDIATRLSYPDWIVQRLVSDLGAGAAHDALAAMNEPAAAVERADGYIQDSASQEVVEVVGVTAGERVVDLCAAPGGKATALAGLGARVMAFDHTTNRARLVVDNASSCAVTDRVAVAVADGRTVPLAPSSIDAVLLDAPCSGLGTLRRRADARWRITEADVGRLAVLQAELLASAAVLVRPGGRLIYSVCTLTDVETRGVDRAFRESHPEFVAEPLGRPWQSAGEGGRLLPTVDGRDGMTCFRYRRTA